jgi:hypothetical protein
MSIGYSTLATSTLLSRFALARIHRKAKSLVQAVSTLPPSATVVIDASSVPVSRTLRLAQSLKALSSLISDFRIFVRLWGLLSIWQWGSSLIKDPPEDGTLKIIAWLQVLVNTGFQYLENGAYLSGKGILGWDEKKQNKAWLWSSRFWAAHVGLEFWKLAYEDRKRKTKVFKDPHSEEAMQERINIRREKSVWARQLLVNAAYAPLTIHWSLEEGLCNDVWVGVLGSIAGISGLMVRWKSTAE